jgi:universal stress protein E
VTQLNSILAVIDPTAEQHFGLNRTIRLAERAHARVELLVCEFASYLSAEQAAIDRLVGERKHWLDELAKPLRERGIDASTDVRWDRPLDEAIVRKVIATTPDLVIEDTHYHSVLKRTLFSNTDWNLIRNCPAPLLLVKGRPTSASPDVLAAVDPFHEHDKPAALDREIPWQRSLRSISLRRS